MDRCESISHAVNGPADLLDPYRIGQNCRQSALVTVVLTVSMERAQRVCSQFMVLQLGVDMLARYVERLMGSRE
jgi:hypothetical protein